MTSVVTFVSPASHTWCTKFMLHICNIWLERVKVIFVTLSVLSIQTEYINNPGELYYFLMKLNTKRLNKIKIKKKFNLTAGEFNLC